MLGDLGNPKSKKLPDLVTLLGCNAFKWPTVVWGGGRPAGAWFGNGHRDPTIQRKYSLYDLYVTGIDASKNSGSSPQLYQLNKLACQKNCIITFQF